ncbi:SDR family oxidoreductase [Salipiger sp. P9]|uniref:SDR family NAD(P)-dependent oxidoreductase n=1 Tax=Salipiger pentaromativorans TaxID=2943193 RepID=UPI002157BABF|nr:SDR family oxidoreductase [Salipiger pentaromativorans]MCR8550633.1 SDR family oxidoreductase [Salipiger pentaromativorans]
MSERKCAAVTGAGHGNGRAIALGLARAGWAVAVLDVDAEAAEESAADIRAEGRDARAYRCDVSDLAACEQVARAIAADLGEIAALVNNAGIVRRGGIADEALYDSLDATFAVNVTGMINTTRAFLPALRSTRGSIVNIASVASFIATPNNVAYNASKGAVKQFTQGLALDLAPEGIRANAIAPGIIETRMTQDTRKDADKLGYFLQRVPMRRVGKPEELVGAIEYLVSDAASYVTGATLPIDGGFLAG